MLDWLTVFTQRTKIRISAPQGWLVSPIHVKFGRDSGSAWPSKITHQSVHVGGNATPKIWKFPLLVKSRPQGRTVWPISTIVRGFCTPNHPALVFYIWDESIYWLRSYCWETARQSITPNFSVHPVGKTMRWIENGWHLFNGLDVLYHHAKLGEDRTTRTGCIGAKMWCFFFLSRSKSGLLCWIQADVFPMTFIKRNKRIVITIHISSALNNMRLI